MHRLRVVPLLLVSLISLATGARALVIPNGTLDPTFNPAAITNGDVTAIVEQPDGKILLGGRFAKVNGAAHLNIARLLADGSIDAGFNAVTDANGAILSLTLQADGKIILLGSFFQVNGVSRNAGIARLNADGTLDTGFNPGGVLSMEGGLNGSGQAFDPGLVSAVIVQPSGRLLVFGVFFYVITGPNTSVARSCAAGFTATGAFDPSFNPGSGFSLTSDATSTFAEAAARQNSTGNVVVAGNFDRFNGQTVPGLVRLSANGAYDPSFNPGSAAPIYSIYDLFAQANDQIVAVGEFTSFNGVPRNRMVRLSIDGAVDSGFVPGALQDYAAPRQGSVILQQSSGKLVISGPFHSYAGHSANGVVRLNDDGSYDPSFVSSNAVGPNGYGESLFVRSDDTLLFGGYFSSYDSVNRNNIARLNANGGLDSGFAPTGVIDGFPLVAAIGTQSDGRIIVGGSFSSFNGNPQYNLMRLFPDGTLDSTFAVGTGASRSVRAMIVLPNDKILLAGQFGGINGAQKSRVALLNPDGTLDSSFDPGSGPNDTVYAITRDSSGNLYLGGSFTAANGIPRARLAKLSPTGALDLAFDPGSGPDNYVFALAPPAETAGCLVGGAFQNFAGSPARFLTRVDATTGSRDAAFATNLGSGFTSSVRAVNLLSSGKYLAGGSFAMVNGSSHPRIARLNSNGSVDNTFGPASPAFNTTAYSLLPFGSRTFVGGAFSLPSSTIARVTDTGVADASFSSGTGATIMPPEAIAFSSAGVNALASQRDGKLIIGGIFNQYNGVARSCLARLTGPELKVTSVSRLPASHILVQGIGEPSTTYTVEGTPSLLTTPFASIGTVTTNASGVFQFDDGTNGAAPAFFYRLAVP